MDRDTGREQIERISRIYLRKIWLGEIPDIGISRSQCRENLAREQDIFEHVKRGRLDWEKVDVGISHKFATRRLFLEYLFVSIEEWKEALNTNGNSLIGNKILARRYAINSI